MSRLLIIDRDGRGKIVSSNVYLFKEIKDEKTVYFTTVSGKVIDMPIMGINEMALNSEGVRLLKLSEGDKVDSILL